MGGIQGDGVLAAPVVLARVGDGVDPAEHAVPDRGPVDRRRGEVHSESGGIGGVEDPVGRHDEHLGGDAPDVQAGAPEGASLDDGRVEPVEFWPQDRVS